MNNSVLYLCKRLAAAVLPLALFFSCATDPAVDTVPPTGDKAMVTVVIKAPGAGTPATRAMTDYDETNVAQIDVLLFEAQNDNNNDPNAGRFFYHGTSNQIDNSAGAKKQFTVSLPVGKYDVVVLANARDLLSGINLTGGMKEDILKSLILDLETAPLNLSAPNHHWPIDTPAPFPMWGDAGPIEIEDGAIIDNPVVQMLRMVARVDLTVTETKFAILGVDVYNYNAKGTLVPVSTEYKTINGVDNVLVADKPNIPVGAQVVRGPLRYNVSDYHSESWTKSFIQNIYLLEGRNIDGDTPRGLTDRTCLVVKGVWSPTGTEADFADESKATYYRVDFSYKDASEFLDVIRNKHYTINIKSVNAHGYEDSQTAFESEPANMTTHIVAWDEYWDEVVFDKNYTIGISPVNVRLEATGAAGNVRVTTNAPSFSYKVWADSDGTQIFTGDWITFDDMNGTSGTITTDADGQMHTKNISYTLSDNPDDNERTAYIHISAENSEVALVAAVTQGVIPYGISLVNFTGTIARSGGNVEVQTTGTWPELYLKAIDADVETVLGTATISGGTGTNTLHKLSVNPNNSSQIRNVAIVYSTDNIRWITLGTGTQVGYIFTVSSDFTDETVVSVSGNTYQVTVSGDHPQLWFQATDGTNTISQDVPNIAAGNDGVEYITIEKNTGDVRDVFLEWADNSSFTDAKTIATGTQTGYSFKVTSNLADGAIISGNRYASTKSTVTYCRVTVTGEHPHLYIRGWDGTQMVSPSVYEFEASTSGAYVSVYTNDNTSGSERVVTLQWAEDIDFTDPKDINYGIQIIYDPYLIQGGYLVARNDLSSQTWAEAMGINTKYNTAYYYNDWGASSSSNNGYQPDMNTGCGSYSETNDGGAMWYLPTSTDFISAGRQGVLTANRNYWCREEAPSGSTFGPTYAYYSAPSTIVWASFVGTKSTRYYVRCIRTAE